MKAQRFKLSIGPDAVMTMIYSDDAADLLNEGKATVTRASNVEPDPAGGWTATMVDGAVLGPFRLRSEALAAEVEYLEAQLF